MRRVGVGVQEADTNRVDAALGEEASRGDGLCLVERLELGAGVVESAADGAHQVGRDDAVRFDPEVAVPISVRHRLPGDLQHELVAVGGDEPEARDPPFEQLIGGNGRAVADGRDDALIGLDHPEHFHHAEEESLGRIGRRRRCLGRNDLAGVFIDRDDVGKRPAGVNSDADPAVWHDAELTGSPCRPRRRLLPNPDTRFGRAPPRLTDPAQHGGERHRRTPG